MANTNRSFGFRPDRFIGGAKWTGEQSLYAFSTSETHDGYNGDVVQFDSTNRTTALTDVYAPGIQFALPVTSTVTTTTIRGVIVGFVPQPEFNMSATASLGLMYRVASTARYGWVIDDTRVVFEVQETGNSYTSASTNGIGANADIAYTAGNTTTGLSGTQLSATVVTNAARPFRRLNYTKRVDNFGFASTDSSSYAKIDVMIINSDLAQGTNGA